LSISIALILDSRHYSSSQKVNKKTDVADHPGVIDHVGLLNNELPSTAGLLFS
jgi:hypothetical protein